MCSRTIFFLFLLGLTSASFAQIDTSRYTYIQYRLNRLDNPDSSYALAGFWEQFDAMRVYGDRQLNIVHFGGSHIQADIYPNVLRNTFHTLDSGRTGARGFLFPYSAIHTNNPWNYKTSYTGTWEGHRSAVYKHSMTWGVDGVTATTRDSVASLSFSFRDSTVAVRPVSVLVMADLSDSSYRLETDSIPHLLLTDTTSEGYLLLVYDGPVDTVFLPFVRMDSTAQLKFYGCIVNSDAPGIVYHSLGGNGSSFRAFARCDLFASQLAYLQPDLVIISIGTNDTSDPDFDPEAYTAAYALFIEQILLVNPHCALILTVPNDSYVRKKYHNNNLVSCRESIYTLAAKYHAAVWDFYTIMGGAYSAKKWRTDQIMKSDLIHFTNEGYQLKGALLMEAMMEDYHHWLVDSGKERETGK